MRKEGLMPFKLVISCLLSSIFLAACGGDSSGCDSGDLGCSPGSGSGSGLGANSSGSNVSFEPLMVWEADADFNDQDKSGYYRSFRSNDWVIYKFIRPLNSENLSLLTPTDHADYSLTVDGVEIDEFESYPILQPVISTEIHLRTALVFDISDSTNQTDFVALIDEAKDYVAAAQSHSNSIISNQQFVVWAFATETRLLQGSTNDAIAINAALDQVVSLRDAVTLGTNSSLHRMIVEGIGRYSDGVSIDFDVDASNLEDFSGADGVFVTQLVLFSSGPDTTAEMEQELMVKAVQSQNFVQLASAGSSTENRLNKPIIYYVLGGSNLGVPYQALAEESEVVNELLQSNGEYEFSNSLIQNQINAIDRRVDLTNQYLYRYAFIPRIGDHDTLFTGADNPISFSLTSTNEEDDISGAAPVQVAVEIAGPNGEYISNNEVSLSEASTFTAATRWTNDVFDNGDYSWAIVNGSGTLNGDGSYTVDSVSSSPATLILTNTLLGLNETIEIFN